MTNPREATDAARQLITWVTAAEDADDGKSRVEGIPGHRPKVEHLALPGFSSGISSGDLLLALLAAGGTITVAAAAKPEGEQAGDRTVWTGDGLTLRLRGKVLEITGSEASDGIKLDGSVKVVRDGDPCDRTMEMQIWMAAVEGFINGLAPGTLVPLTSATCATSTASTKKVLAG